MIAELVRALLRAQGEVGTSDAIIWPRSDASLEVFIGACVLMSPRRLCKAGWRGEIGKLERIKPMSWDPGEVSFVLGPIWSHTSALFELVSVYGHTLS